MPRLHNVNKKAYEVSKKKMKKTVHIDEIYGAGMQMKTPNLDEKPNMTVTNSSITKAKIKSKELIEVEYMMSRLIAKHKDNIAAMVYDPLNVLQFTEHKLEKEYNIFMKLSDETEVDLSEKMLKQAELDEIEPAEPEIETMNVVYAERVEQLEKMMK